jgi:hypothetical protein
MESAMMVVLHSWSPVPGGLIPPLTFFSTLESFGNPSLWANLNVDGDGEWICAGVLSDSLVIVHDGSYMPEQCTILCLAGIVIYCRNTRFWLKASITERSSLASNYKGELLGAVLALLFLWAATALETALLPGMILYCDSKGVISHANSPLMSLPEKQEQAILI